MQLLLGIANLADVAREDCRFLAGNTLAQVSKNVEVLRIQTCASLI